MSFARRVVVVLCSLALEHGKCVYKGALFFFSCLKWEVKSKNYNFAQRTCGAAKSDNLCSDATRKAAESKDEGEKYSCSFLVCKDDLCNSAVSQSVAAFMLMTVVALLF
eukprot:sb/3477454/